MTDWARLPASITLDASDFPKTDEEIWREFERAKVAVRVLPEEDRGDGR